MKYLVIAATLVGSQAMAQAPCGPHEEVTSHLAETYHETPRLEPLDNQGRLIEFFGADNGSWTLTLTTPGGLTCFMNAGEVFDTVAPAPLGEEG